jgi:hypothetical protein
VTDEGDLRRTLADEIAATGEAAISDMIGEGREESLHLEFKTLASDAAFTKDDRKMLAKAICGLQQMTSQSPWLDSTVQKTRQ